MSGRQKGQQAGADQAQIIRTPIAFRALMAGQPLETSLKGLGTLRRNFPIALGKSRTCSLDPKEDAYEAYPKDPAHRPQMPQSK
jgi:hypothetical protein